MELRLLESLQQAQAGWQETEAAARAQLLADKEAADREWIETKAVRAARARRGGAARGRPGGGGGAAAAAGRAGRDGGGARRWRSRPWSPTLVAVLPLLWRACLLPRHVCPRAHRSVHPPGGGATGRRERDQGAARHRPAPAARGHQARRGQATGGSGTGTSAGTGEGGELAQELAAARRGLQAAQEGLAAEKGILPSTAGWRSWRRPTRPSSALSVSSRRRSRRSSPRRRSARCVLE